MTTMLSLILAFMLTMGGSPAVSVSSFNCIVPESGVSADITGKPRLGEFLKIYPIKAESNAGNPRLMLNLSFQYEKPPLIELNQAFNQNPVNFVDPLGSKTDFNYFGTTKTYGEALRSLVITDADRRILGRIAEGGANLVPGIAYLFQDIAEVFLGEEIFEDEWKFRFNFSEPGSMIQIYEAEKRTGWEKIRDATIVYPTGKFLADAGSNFILGYNDLYVMHTPVGQEARENFDRQLIPLGATGYGIYKGIKVGWKQIKGGPEFNNLSASEIIQVKKALKEAGMSDASVLLEGADMPPNYYGMTLGDKGFIINRSIINNYNLLLETLRHELKHIIDRRDIGDAGAYGSHLEEAANAAEK